MLGAGCGHEQRFGPIARSIPVGSQEEVADLLSQGGPARLPGEHGAEGLGQHLGLSGFSGPLAPFDGDQATRHVRSSDRSPARSDATATTPATRMMAEASQRVSRTPGT